MHLVLIDLIPALLRWEGRDRSEEPELAPGAAHALGHLFDRFQMIGVADSGIPAPVLRVYLEQAEVSSYFDHLLTSAAFGPTLNARVVRKIGRRAAGERGIVVTARTMLAEELRRAGEPVVVTTHADFESVPDAVFDLADGRVTP